MNENILALLEGVKRLDVQNTNLLNKDSKKNEFDFILALLNSFKNDSKKLNEILKSFHISKEDLKKILNKLPQNEKEKFEKILSKIQSEKDSQTSNILSLLINPSAETNVSEKNVHIPKEKEKTLLNMVKKQIQHSFKIENIKLTKTQTDKFKQIKTFKELIDFANKNGLNIKKIVISKIQTTLKKDFSRSVFTKEATQTKISKLVFIKKTSVKSTQNSKKVISPLKSLVNEKTQKNKNEGKSSLFRIEFPDKNSSDATKTKTDAKKEEFHTQNVVFENRPDKTKKNDNDDSKNGLQLGIQTTQLKTKIITAKQTLTHFAHNLKEAVENYKPPMTKISFEMHPKELGKIEMTLYQRGDRLKIQINTNTSQTVNFFVSHQNDLKNVLVNMGYTEVNMNFNSKDEQKKQGQNKNAPKIKLETDDAKEEFFIEIPYIYA